jgi:hypothetical protein
MFLILRSERIKMTTHACLVAVGAVIIIGYRA